MDRCYWGQGAERRAPCYRPVHRIPLPPGLPHSRLGRVVATKTSPAWTTRLALLGASLPNRTDGEAMVFFERSIDEMSMYVNSRSGVFLGSVVSTLLHTSPSLTYAQPGGAMGRAGLKPAPTSVWMALMVVGGVGSDGVGTRVWMALVVVCGVGSDGVGTRVWMALGVVGGIGSGGVGTWVWMALMVEGGVGSGGVGTWVWMALMVEGGVGSGGVGTRVWMALGVVGGIGSGEVGTWVWMASPIVGGVGPGEVGGR